jgi:paraquat-inducible protein A
MIDVFLLGVFVAYTRLRVLANVDIEPSLLALGGAMLAMVAADASLDRHAVWTAFERHAPRRRALARERGKLVGCHTCGLVARSAEGVACARCGHVLHRRRKGSIAWSCAFMLAALVLYIPANAYPIMTVIRMGRGGPHTLVNGVVELFEDHLWPLAVVVLLASVIVPLLKLGGLTALLLTTHRRAKTHLVARTRVFRFLAVIGRWSMIDIFSLATLVAMVRMGFLATVIPGQGAAAFAAVVVFTMLSTECFDPRLMWDAAETNGPRALPVAERHSMGMAL